MSASWEGEGDVVVVVPLVWVGLAVGDVVGVGDTLEVLEVDGDGRTLGGTLGPGAGGRALDRVADVVGVSDWHVRCRSASHAGAPRAIASSGQVIRYIEMLRSVCQRPPRNDTQYGSPECSLAITAQPLPQSMMREPLPG